MRSRAALVALALAICFASVVSATETLVAEEENMPYHAPRVPTRDEERLDSALSDRASLLFRAMDKDHDKHIGVQDVKNSLPELERHMPGVHEKEFMAFLEMADKDGDKKLSYGELVDGLADGLDEGEDMKESASPEQNAAASLGLLETGAEVHMHEQQQRQRRGRAHHQQQVEEEQQVEEQDQAQEQDQQGQEEQISAAERRRGQGLNKRSEMRFAQRIFQQVKGLLKRELGTQKQKQQQKRSQTARTHRTSRRRQHRATEQVKGGDDGCVMCQYILERCESNVKQSGVLASMASAEGFGAYLELDTKITPKQQDVSTPVGDAASFLETGSQQIFNDLTAATIIGSARQSTRVQRQLERQKYNEIYRIADLSLDDVCEQGMPNSFYGHCKAIYKKQSDVVDGLRYQYRAADICVRIGMCKGKYITKGIHSRYKGK